MMSIGPVIAQLDHLALQPFVQAGGRVMFEQFGAALIAGSALTPDEADTAATRLAELALELPVVLAVGTDWEEASRLCQQTAFRLTVSPWYAETVASWPAPIAHELHGLANCLTGQGRPHPSPEAALLQLRDLGETMVKLPASILARRLTARGGEDADQIRRALRDVRGGGWHDLARRAVGLLSAAEKDGPLGGLLALLEPGSPYAVLLARLSSARNDNIGHGALRSNPADTARIVAWFAAGRVGDQAPSGPSGAIPSGATILSAFADAAQHRPWAGLALEAVDGDESIGLTGALALQRWYGDGRHVAHSDRELPVRLLIAGQAPLLLSPLVQARICKECGRRDVFFFDNVYDARSRRVDFLDYGRGHKSRLPQAEAADLLEELGPLLLSSTVPASGSLDSRVAVAALDAMRVDRRYRSPAYLRNPFAAFLDEHDGGVYWLQAPAHVGKTMFVQGLANTALGDQPISPGLGPSDAIAAFFCKREYREGRLTFLNALASTLKRVLDVSDGHEFPTSAEVTGAPDPRRAFAGWLDRWRAMAKPAGRRLLVIVDGLDETDAPGPDSLLGLLPAADDLSAGQYLLLTSRPTEDADCPAWLGGALAPLRAMVRRFGLDEPNYRALMRDYARDRLGFDRSPARTAEIDALIRQAEDRFVFLGFLVEQRRLGHSAQGTGEALYQVFLDGLEDRFGAKQADTLLSVLSCLTAAELVHEWMFGAGARRDAATGGVLAPLPRDFPGLDLGVLAEVAGLDEATSKGGRALSVGFVEALLLLQGALWVWRGEGGSPRYRLGLKGFAVMLATRRPEVLRRLRMRLATACLDALDLAAAALEEDEISPAPWQATGRELFPLLPGLIAAAASEPLTHRYRTAAIGSTAFTLQSQYGATQAANIVQVRWYSAVLAALNDGCGPAQDGESMTSNLANAYMNRGNAKQSAPGFGPVAAIADYDVAVTLQEALRDGMGEDWPVSWDNDLASAYMNRGNAKQYAPGLGPVAAIADYDVAVTLQEALRDGMGGDWPVAWRNDLASAYMNRGTAKQDAADFGPVSAIADYDAAAALQEALRDGIGEEWPLPWRNGLACVYMNRGIAKESAPGFGPASAIADYDAAVLLREALRDEMREDWPLPWRNDLACAYVNRGNAKQSAPDFGPVAAIADYDAAVALQEALRDGLGGDWPVPWRNQLAGAYVSRGNAKEDAPDFSPASAIDDYDAAVALQEALRDEMGEGWPVPWRNQLARAYVSRGTAKQDAPGFGPVSAIADYDAAVTLQEVLRDGMGGDWPVAWRNDLASAYMNRGNAKRDAPGLGPVAAIADYDAAVTLREALRDGMGEDWPVPWCNQLAGAYMSRGHAKRDAPGLGPVAAIADYDVAVTLQEALRDGMGGDWPVAWCNQLAGAYMSRGNAKQYAPGLGPVAAIADYDAAVMLREALRDGMGEDWPVPWHDDLASAYMRRGIAKQDAPGFGHVSAIADYDAAIETWTHLRTVLGPDWRDEDERGLRQILDAREGL